MINVIIADDHDMVRQSIALMLDTIIDIKVIGEAKSGEEAVQLSRKISPDVVLMDVRMPGMGGLEASKRILKYSEGATQIVGLSGYNDELYPSLFVRAGALGYITKDAGTEDMVKAIRQVNRGEVYLSPGIAHRVVYNAKREENDNPFDKLSERELQIALLLIECNKPATIAEKLNLSPKTINSYKYRVFEKLDAHSDIELTLLALRYAIIDPEAAIAASQKNSAELEKSKY